MTSDSPDGANAPLLGQVVADRYFVDKHLGEGGMGTVYRARHITLEKLVALKVLHGEFSRKQELVDRFLQEAKAASRIRNAHVIDITDFGVTGDGYVFFAMEYLEGKDLHALLKETTNQGGLLPWPRALDIFLQICEALAAAHAEGIIHRDLKPENIFLVDGTGREDYVKLLDFGIAKVESTSGDEGERKLTKTGMLFGTPEYMAPEQARGEKPDHRVDVYAMGCMLFQFLTGTVPFKADSFMAVLTQHMVEPMPAISPELLARSGAPIEILAVVQKALEKDREMRYESIVELAAAAFDASNGSSAALGASSADAAPLRSSRPTYSAGDWTGSVRKIDEIDASAGEAVAAVEQAPSVKSRRLLIGAAMAAVVGVGAIALLLNNADKTPAQDVKPSAGETQTLSEAAEPASTEPTSAEEPAIVPSIMRDASPDDAPSTATASGETAPTPKNGRRDGKTTPDNKSGSPEDPAKVPGKAKTNKPGQTVVGDPKSGEDAKVPKQKTPDDDTSDEPELMFPPELESSPPS